MLEAHPLAELFPMMGDGDLAKLIESMQRVGYLQDEPIVLYEGKILDGRNRALACAKLSIQPITKEWDGDGDPLEYVVSKNLCRRHLNDTQRALVAARIANMRQGGNGSNQHERANRPAGRFAPISQRQAAGMMNVSERSVRRAHTLEATGTPELKAAVNAEVISLSAGAALATRPAEEQKEIASRRLFVVGGTDAQTEVTLAPEFTRAGPAGDGLSVPEGGTVEEQARKIMALEAEGQTTEQAAKAIGIGVFNYRRIRDLITIKDQMTDMPPRERGIVIAALDAINRTCRMYAYGAAEQIVHAVWGGSKQRHTVQVWVDRVEGLGIAVGSMATVCSQLADPDYEMPLLPVDERDRRLKELRTMQRDLTALIKRLDPKKAIPPPGDGRSDFDQEAYFGNARFQIRKLGSGGGLVTADHVHGLCPLPAGADPHVLESVIREEDGWLPLGPVASSKTGPLKGRRTQQWKLRQST